jgi:hypothetical protein
MKLKRVVVKVNHKEAEQEGRCGHTLIKNIVIKVIKDN